jgi:hypothetical protein
MLAAVSATAALPVPAFVLAEIGLVIPRMPVELGAIRVCSQNDLNTYTVSLRFDALNLRTQEQLVVDARIAVKPTLMEMRKEYLLAREPAEWLLRKEIEHRKWRADDLAYMPPPAGWIEPPWMRANA